MVVTIPQHLPHTAAMDPHRMTATAATAATDRHHTAAMAATAAMDRHHTADTARCRLGSTKGMGGRLDTALPHHLSQAASGCASHFRHQVSFYSNTDSCHISRQDLSVILLCLDMVALQVLASMLTSTTGSLSAAVPAPATHLQVEALYLQTFAKTLLDVSRLASTGAPQPSANARW